jgi:pimeloyl-ACP methyl ester carboxylesterase
MDQASAETGRKLHLIGHSLGGLLARSAAAQRPEQVEQVISLASPFRDIRVHPMILAAAGFVRGRIVRERASSREARLLHRAARAIADSLTSGVPDPVKRTAIYTKTDGVVDWRSCVEEDSKLNIEVQGTHSGLAFNPQVYRTIGKLLAGSGGKRKRK